MSTVETVAVESPTKTRVTAKPKAAPEKVDLAALAAKGELWVKPTEFNERITCSSLCFIGTARYLSFNLYNGALGKKSKVLPIDEVIQGQESVGYAVKDGAKLRERLARDGYKKFGE